jgi:hypothetical protein
VGGAAGGIVAVGEAVAVVADAVAVGAVVAVAVGGSVATMVLVATRDAALVFAFPSVAGARPQLTRRKSRERQKMVMARLVGIVFRVVVYRYCRLLDCTTYIGSPGTY